MEDAREVLSLAQKAIGFATAAFEESRGRRANFRRPLPPPRPQPPVARRPPARANDRPTAAERQAAAAAKKAAKTAKWIARCKQRREEKATERKEAAVAKKAEADAERKKTEDEAKGAAEKTPPARRTSTRLSARRQLVAEQNGEAEIATAPPRLPDDFATPLCHRRNSQFVHVQQRRRKIAKKPAETSKEKFD
ncbi:hypothetical protein M3Y99_00383000 [Aphelenchoides fujianensis]|nr:hypothetical protein M3Y99_00383000 [Aphelenchoides fujianensis]